MIHPRISVSALSSVRWSFQDDPPSGGRVPFGEGDLPIARILHDIKATGYAGPLELELIGPLGDREGYAPVIRRGVAAAEAMLAEAGF